MNSNPYARLVKPALDGLSASAALLFMAPLFMVVAIAIKVDSPGPVWYRQERVGKDGRIFRIFKFRSMVVGAESMGAGVRVETRDARVTRVGRLLRRLSVDELPQLMNVVRGEMSLVGPRPTLAYQVAQYDEFQRRRLLVRPGLTGWAQVHGRNEIPWDQRIRLDVEYVEHLGPGMDLAILFRTIPIVLFGRGRFTSGEYWKR